MNKLQTLGIDGRRVTCRVEPDGVWVRLTVVCDAGVNTPQDRTAEMLGADIRRAFNRQGWSRVTRDVYAGLLAAGGGSAGVARNYADWCMGVDWRSVAHRTYGFVWPSRAAGMNLAGVRVS